MPEALATLPILLASACVLAAVAAWHLWYGWGVSRVLGAQGLPTWRAWVPLLREAELFRLGNVDPVRAALLLVPVVAVYGFVLQVIAMHRIGARYGRGAGTTVLGAVLPPAWATVLAGAQPAAERVETPGDEDPASLLLPGADAAASGVPAPAAAPIDPAPVTHPPGVAVAAAVPVAAAPPITHVPGVSAPPPAPAPAPAPASAPAPHPPPPPPPTSMTARTSSAARGSGSSCCPTAQPSCC